MDQLLASAIDSDICRQHCCPFYPLPCLSPPDRRSAQWIAAKAIGGTAACSKGWAGNRGNGHADLTFVYGAAREITKALSKFTVVVTKSTVPVGTSNEVERIIRENPQAEFAVVSNPEFLREGATIRDFKHPDRIVIGTGDARARSVVTEIYWPLHLDAPPILNSDRRTAELIKYGANCFLAMKVAFINEIDPNATSECRESCGYRPAVLPLPSGPFRSVLASA